LRIEKLNSLHFYQFNLDSSGPRFCCDAAKPPPPVIPCHRPTAAAGLSLAQPAGTTNRLNNKRSGEGRRWPRTAGFFAPPARSDEDNCRTCHGRNVISPGLVTFDLRKFPKDDAARFRGAVLNGKAPSCPPSPAA